MPGHWPKFLIEPAHGHVLGLREPRQNGEPEVPYAVVSLEILDTRVVGELERLLEGVPYEQPVRGVLGAEVLGTGTDSPPDDTNSAKSMC